MVWSKRLKLIVAMVFAFYGFLQTAEAQTNDEKLNILVHEFVLDTNESRTNSTIEISIPLGNSFKRFSDVRILDRSIYPQLKLEDLQNRNVSDDLGEINVVVFGSYIIVNEYVKINSVIYNANTGLYHPVNYSRGSLDGFEVLVEEVADDIYEALVEISPLLQGSVKKIAIDNEYETVTGIYDNFKMLRTKSEEFTKEIIREVEYQGPSNSEVVPWQTIREYKDANSAELITKLEPDMYIELIWMFDKQEIVGLRTNFKIIEYGRSKPQVREFSLPELKSGYYNNIDFKEYVISELTDFLSRIININGQWDFIDFPNKTSSSLQDPDVLIYKANNLSARNDFYLSNYYFYEALNQFPESVNPVDIRLQIGFNMIYLGRYEKANEDFDFVLSQPEDNGSAYLGKSIIEYYQTNYDAALKFLDQAVANGFDNLYMIEALKGFYYFRSKSFKDAYDAFNKALQLQPGKIKIRLVHSISKANLKIHIGLCYLSLSQFDEAVDYYEQLKVEFPNNDEMPYYLGNAYSKRGIEDYFAGNYKQAINDFTSARKYYQNSNINDYLRTAFIYEKMFAEAATYIEGEIKAGMYDPKFIWMTHGMDIRMLLIEDQIANPEGGFDKRTGDEAINALSKNLEVDANDPLTYYYLGEINIILGRFEKGLHFMEKAFESDQFDFEIQCGLMQAYLINNEFDACEKTYKKVSKINRKAIVTPRATALMNFFLVSASFAQDKKEKKALKELEGLIKDKVLIDQWIFEPYLNWLENCACSSEGKAFMLELAKKMKELSRN